ncbi:hypothetical protein FZEAL_6650 [Fusarium zealandicum]|uniref:Uncharacterized protein n=1 Tax=Fusarium zealandicum TaxID=1053134 RepID=A0A8H4UHN8_9HYPO|nr:hypothetical protein FZEAL_6650 [Fusarium zealandicum]
MSQQAGHERQWSSSELTLDQQDKERRLEHHSLISDEASQARLRHGTSATKTIDSEYNAAHMRPMRSTMSPLTLWHFFLDILFALPGFAFLVFAILVRIYDGQPLDQEPAPALRSIATYGPTIFPIVFAAAAVNFLKAVAAWKLERGISVLSLEFLLSSRTVFSTIASPIALGAVNYLTPLLVILWALSPLGGQAALRVVGTAPSSQVEHWSGRYVEFRGELPYQEDADGVPHSLPAVIATFGAALSSPKDVKAAGQDTFGHVKVPMIESFLDSQATLDDDGWFAIKDETNAVYSSLAGLPIASNDPFSRASNYSFNLTTSYLHTDCKVSHVSSRKHKTWKASLYKHIRKAPAQEAPSRFHNDLTMAIEVVQRYNESSHAPMKLNFTSYTRNETTTASCNLTTSYVQVDVACHLSNCNAVRIRPMEHEYDVASTVLNGLAPTGWMEFYDEQYGSFLGYFVNSSNNLWDWVPETDLYSSPIELYITNPDIPYAVLPNGRGWRGEEIWPVGDALFSTRFTQLLNSFWLAQIAPFAPMGRVNISTSNELKKELQTLDWRSVNGTRTPDIVVLRAEKPWLATLIIASLVMLSAALAAAILNVWRRGPDILDYATSMMRDNPYVNVDSAHQGCSMEDGVDRTRRLMAMKVRLGDICPEENEGYIAMATPERASRLTKAGKKRVFR